MPEFKAVFWDLDGTLAYWRSPAVIFRIAWLYLSLCPPHLGWPRALLTSTRAYLGILKNAGPLSNDELYNRTVCLDWGSTPEEVRAVTSRLLASERLEEIIRQYVRTIPEAIELVELVASRGLTQYVATNPVMPSGFNRLRLEVAGYRLELFSNVSGSEQFAGQKTSVDFYRRLLALAGQRPEESLMIGNDPKKDLVAMGAGMSVFLLTTPLAVANPYPGSFKPDAVGGYQELRRYLLPRR
jgi:FMN phosphatase YigB (HAD superfamily)